MHQRHGNLIPLIKMLKAWNRKTGSFFHSFHLEVLALSIFARVEISDYSSGARFFFGRGKDRVALPMYDPAGHGDDIARYLDTYEKKNAAVLKFQSAYERAVRAEDYQLRGQTQHTVEVWRQIFGDYFPTYG